MASFLPCIVERWRQQSHSLVDVGIDVSSVETRHLDQITNVYPRDTSK